ncbi:MAG TPA: D-2-hydroxyacid dehydrogenase [Actinomycetota bacterium]|nr:D-2-hydroxyacid dehydrogenase [Actinomycetota bacterium]
MTPRPVVVVMGAEAGSPPPGIEEAAEVVELRYAPTEASLADLLPGADALFAWGSDPGWLPRAWTPPPSHLRWIQSASAGVDMLLFPELVESEVVVTNARGVFEEPIAEWIIGAMLAFATGLHRSIVDQQRGTWTTGRATERLAGSRLAVVGPGPIGRNTASRAIALGMSVSLVGRRPRRHETFGDVLGVDQLHAALRGADHVLDALPLTDETRGLFDAASFGAMDPRARFYNVGRGGTVDEPAMIEALRTGVIAGAALDVFATEPLPDDSLLWTMPNVIVSPHVSGDVEGWETLVVAIFVENARRFAAGDLLANLVDKRAGHGVGDPPPDLGRGLPPGPSGNRAP